ncbi:hypothetical protein ACF3NG_10175 [Aerococcaceae bacterium WGS1372]
MLTEELMQTYIDDFQENLKSKKLTEKNIKKHTENIDFYLKEYIPRFEWMETLGETAQQVDDFLGYFFIRKCTWSSPTTIKENAATFKKFYKLMLDKGRIEKADYDIMKDLISEGLDEWIADCIEYGSF